MQNSDEAAEEMPQFQMGATSSDAETYASMTKLPGPGAIADRLGQQFQIPRAEPDTTSNRDHGTPYG